MKTSISPTSKTRVTFDLASVLSEEELHQFEESAKKAGAANLTEHFLNITLRLQDETYPNQKKEAA